MNKFIFIAISACFSASLYASVCLTSLAGFVIKYDKETKLLDMLGFYKRNQNIALSKNYAEIIKKNNEILQ